MQSAALTISACDVWALPYPDFVALIAEDNVPPGGLHACLYWQHVGRITQASILLDLACSTGFSSRNLAATVGCSASGIDRSQSAVDTANDRAREDGLDDRISYVAADAAHLPFSDGQFTHVLVGSSFGFIAERDKALAEAARVLRSDGGLCVACRHYISEPPKPVLERAEEVLGYRPDGSRTYEWWTRFFRSHFSRVEEARLMRSETETRAHVEALLSKLNSPTSRLASVSSEVRQAIVRRFEQTREAVAENNKYQEVMLMVWRR